MQAGQPGWICLLAAIHQAESDSSCSPWRIIRSVLCSGGAKPACCAETCNISGKRQRPRKDGEAKAEVFVRIDTE
jgi:hypothetical protein